MKRRALRSLGVTALAVGAVAILVLVWVLLGPAPRRPVSGGIGAPLTMEQFKLGLGCRESHGDYDARNDRTDAIGKYQVLPVNWRAWAGRWAGDRRADPTPANQEAVATGKLDELHRALDGNWARIAFWWLTGREDADRSRWSDFGNGYVDDILAYARAAQTAGGRETIPVSCFSTPELPRPLVRPTLSV